MMQPQRSAFSMITAIFVILMMSTVAIFIMNLSGKIIKETTTQYQKEQAVLLAKSYTELAIMTVMANDRNGTSCIRTINGTVVAPGGTITNADTNGEGYRVRTHIGFIAPTADLGSCSTGVRDFGGPDSGNELNIIVDVYVEYKDIGQNNIAASPYITYHRRTLQKI